MVLIAGENTKKSRSTWQLAWHWFTGWSCFWYQAIPADPIEAGAWLASSSRRVSLALNLVPFAGIAFMWFLGVLRDRLGTREDKFFATVFLGSGLIFLSMLFVAASAVGALILAYSVAPGGLPNPSAFAFGRAFTYDIMHIYASKMAAVFMITTSTLALRTRAIHRWIAALGYALVGFLLIVSNYFDWTFFVFPAWVLLVSAYIMIDNLSTAARPTRR